MPIYIANSKWLIAITSIFYGSIALALVLVNWPYWLCLLLALFLGYDYWQVICRHGLRQHAKSVAILQQDCDKWQYQLFSGKRYKAQLIPQRSYACGLVLILYFKHLTGGRYLLIPRDAISQHNYRFLCFALHCAG